MTVTKMLVVYSVAQSRVRRVIVPDHDIEIARYENDIVPGEATTIMDWPGYLPDLDELNAAVAAITGTPTLDDIHYVVDAEGNVVASYRLDPAIDDVGALPLPQGTELVASADADRAVRVKQAETFADKVGVPKDDIDTPSIGGTR
jgi:hypothetical protein